MGSPTKIKLLAIAVLLSSLSLTALANSQLVGAIHCPPPDQILFEGDNSVYALGDWSGKSFLPADKSQKWKRLINKVTYSTSGDEIEGTCRYTINGKKAVTLSEALAIFAHERHLYYKKQRVSHCADDPREPNQPCYWYIKPL